MQKIPTNYENSFKIIFLGNYGVGKTSIIRNYMYGTTFKFHSAKRHIDKQTHSLIYNNSKILFEICDITDEKQIYSIPQTYFKNVSGIVLMYDLTNKRSLDDLSIWSEMILKYTTNPPVILVGNKMDLLKDKSLYDRDVLYMMNTILLDLNIIHITYSSDNDYNSISNIFNHLTEHMIKHPMVLSDVKHKLESINLNDDDDKPTQRSSNICCC
jgi:small GTP-binding protein